MNDAAARLSERLFAALQWCLPTRLVSRLVHSLAQSRADWLKRGFINGFCRLYAIDLQEAAQPDRRQYPSFNAFFTRALADGARPLAEDPRAIVSPVDGRMGAFGAARAGRVYQTKGMAYDLRTLVGSRDAWAAAFLGGAFATLYLAPANYHRVHMPIDGTLRESLYVPGRLFGVNPACVRAIPRLFTRNERLVTIFDTAVGPMAMVMVGAFCVGGIQTRWAGTVCPPHRRGTQRLIDVDAGAGPVHFARGEEMGRFNLGSSVILLFGPGALEWQADLAPAQPLVLGRAIARISDGP